MRAGPLQPPNRLTVLCGSKTKTPQYVIPRRAVGPFQPLRGFRISDDLFGPGVPPYLAPGAERNIGQVAGRGHLMALLDVGDGPFARLEAIEKIADVRIELLLRGATHLVRLNPRFERCIGMLRPA